VSDRAAVALGDEVREELRLVPEIGPLRLEVLGRDLVP
jgi:hypothetical protein